MTPQPRTRPPRTHRRWLPWVLVVAGVVGAGLSWHFARAHGLIATRPDKRRSVAEVVQQVGPSARARLEPHFRRAGVPYPPTATAWVALKDEKRLELWARHDERWVWIHDYAILAASGGPGPKLAEGDRQVPEGLYRVVELNPNSRFHLSLKLDYPNTFDRARAAHEGRTNLGGDIFVHGKRVSIGCLAMGDEAIEELFVLSAAVGRQRTTVLVVPTDLRLRPPPSEGLAARPWMAGLYAELERALAPFDRAHRDTAASPTR